MKEHPTLFNTAMIRLIRAGLKHNTRRPMKPQPTHFQGGVPFWVGCQVLSPFGVAGDRLWCRETWAPTSTGGAVFFADFHDSTGHFWESIASNPKDVRWHPSIHLPRSLCRTVLEVKKVWCEHLQDITDDGARAEGFADREAFRKTWDSIYAKRGLGWDANPWVWVADFEEVKP